MLIDTQIDVPHNDSLKSKDESALSAVSDFYVRFLLISLFAYAAFIHPRPSGNEIINKRAEAKKTQKILESENRKVLSLYEEVAQKRMQLSSMSANRAKSSAVKTLRQQIEMAEERAKLLETQISALSRHVSLLEAKAVELKIPIVDWSLPEPLLLSLFPVAVFGSWLRIWYLRRQHAKLGSIKSPPLWMMPKPIPLGLDSSTILQLAVRNTFGLAIIMFSLAITFIFLGDFPFGDDERVKALGHCWTIVGAITGGLWGWSLVEAIVSTLRGEENASS
jgi:hypothetical protein